MPLYNLFKPCYTTISIKPKREGKIMNGNRIIVAAHRGDRKSYPENTMPAFVSAEKLGVDMIETDSRQTADGHLVIIHDRSALRTCGVDRNIDTMTLAEVRELDAGSPFSPAFAGVKVPTVEEFLVWLEGNDLLVNWELKDYPRDMGEEFAFRTADLLVELIKKHGMENRSMVNSFSARVLEHIKAENDFPVHGQGIYYAPRSVDTPDMSLLDLFDWCCLYPEQQGTSPVDYPEQFAYCRAHGILPCICIADEMEPYARAIEYGCRMFTTNDIVACQKILGELGVK